jgi:hypothetical protein
LKLIIATIAILAISSLLLVPVVSVYADTALPMTGSQWAILELVDSKIKTTHADTIPTGGVQFSLPDATGSPPSFVNLLTNGFTASLATSNTLTAKIQVVASSGNRYVGNPDGSCPVSGPTNCPGTVRLYFTSNLPQAGMSSCLGTNGNSQHTIVANEFDYWWSNTPLQATDAGTPGSYYQFSPGGSSSGPVITLSVSLDPGMWSDLCGTVGSVNVPAFMASISNIKDVGLSFGSGFFFENGVGVDGTTGSATFQLTSYTIT